MGLAFGVACGGPLLATSGDAGSGYAAPVIEGPYAFNAQTVLGSSQTSGGGATVGDNLYLKISEGCGAFGNRAISIDLYSLDKSPLKAGTINVERSTNGYAAVSYRNDAVSGSSRQAISGSVVMNVVDTTTIQNNRGSFNVKVAEPDGGRSLLSGSFDARYLCH